MQIKTICTFILLLFYCSIVQNSFGQNTKIDSLLSLLKTDKEDTNKIIHLNSLCDKYRNISKYDSVFHYGNMALALANKLNFKKGIVNSFKNFGNAYGEKGEYANALEYYSKALKICEEMENKIEVALLIGNIGLIYSDQGNYSKALEYYFNALKITEALDNKAMQGKNLANIGIIYWHQKDYPKALEYLFRSLKIDEDAGNKRGIGIQLGNIGNVYADQKDYTKALEYYLKALKISEELGIKRNIANWLGNIGVLYYNQGNIPKTLEYLLKALKINEEIGEKNGIAILHGNIGELYVKQKKYKEAEEHLLKTLSIAKEIGSLKRIKQGNENLSKLYFEKGDYKKAYEHHQQYSIAKDSIFNEQSSKQIHEMSTKYETEKKEQQIKLLNKDKEIQNKDLQRQKTIRNAVAGGLMLVLLFSFVLINRLLLIRKQKKLIEIEREKSEKLLLNILPKETADELKLNNSVKPKFYKQVTVMFTDFKGFTTIAEKMSAEELVSELDFTFKKFDDIISKYPIEKIKTIGDAYMCAGGLPVVNTTNPIDVVMAGLEICEFMKSRQVVLTLSSESQQPKAKSQWQIRIGVHTGSVIAGVVGDKKFAYDIWGDTVNTASRMESSGEAGKVNISGETYKMLVGTRHAVSLQFQFRGKIPAKNKGEIEMYFVERKTI